MSSRFNVFVNGIQMDDDYTRVRLDVSFVGMDGDSMTCDVIIDDLKDPTPSYNLLNIRLNDSEVPKKFLEKLLDADKFYIEIRLKAPDFGTINAFGRLDKTLRQMTAIWYGNGPRDFVTIFKYKVRNTKMRLAPQEYWDEQKMKQLLGSLIQTGEELKTLCHDSSVETIHLGDSEVAVSELMAYLEKMQSDVFGNSNQS